MCVDSFTNDGFQSFQICIKSTVTSIEMQNLGPLPFAWIHESVPLCSLMDRRQFKKRIQDLGRRCDAVFDGNPGLGIGVRDSAAAGSELAEHAGSEIVKRKGRPPVFVRKTPGFDHVIEQLRSVEVDHGKA